MSPPADTVAPSPAVGAASPSPVGRLVAVFARPAAAWAGLDRRAQWWFPLLVVMVVSALAWSLSYRQTMIPTMVEAWERSVEAGQMPPAQLERLEEFFDGPGGLAVVVIQQVVLLPVFTLLVALVVWFGVGFVLGTGMRFRLAFEVAAWSGLIGLPGLALTLALGSIKGTLRGVHTGFGILLPATEDPGKLQVALGVLLDALGPLSIWYLLVGILGAAALSGAPRKSVAWVLGGLYVLLAIFGAGLAAVFSPGS